MAIAAYLDHEKQAAARAAVDEVRDGMIVGLGTGSTAAFAIGALADRCRKGLRIEAVATSHRSEELALQAGITMLAFATLPGVDLCIDGVDEIDAGLRAIKGAGGAMLREKIVARAASRMIAIADGSKAVDQLGRASVPIEVLPFALAMVTRAVEKIGGRPVLRKGPAGAYLTDQGNYVLDCGFGLIAEPAALAEQLQGIPGLLGHGLFVGDIDALYIGRAETVEYRSVMAG